MSENPDRPSTETRDSSPEMVRNQYDWESTPPSIAVVTAVSTATDAEPTELKPLYSRIDPDLLNAVLTRRTESLDGGDLQLSFSYEDYDVTVVSDGEVTVKRRWGPP